MAQRVRGSRVYILVSFVLLTWAVFGGFLLHFYLANFITMMLKPQYELPVDSAQDIIDRGLIPFAFGDYFKEFLTQSPNPLYQQLGHKMVEIIDETTFDRMLREDVLVSNTHVMLGGLFKHQDEFGKFHRSDDVLKGSDPNYVTVVNRFWEYREAYNHHLLLFHQVGIVWTEHNMIMKSID